MSSQNQPAGYYSGPGGSSQVPNSSFNGWKLLDPNNITGVGNKGMAPPTDFGAAAQAQGQSNQQAVNQQTQANRPNQQTGFGNVQWTRNADGSWTQNASLNPTLSGAMGSLQQQAANNAATGPQNIADARNQAIQSNYGQATSRLDPQWKLRDEQLSTQLANQGLAPGSEAWKQAMQQESFARNDAYTSAMNSAIGEGNQTEAMQLQAQLAPYQQMSALQGYENGMPAFAAAGMAGPVPYLQGAEAAAGLLDSTNRQNQQNGADVVSGAMSMGGKIFASDERLKTNVHRLPREPGQRYPFATYKYKDDPEAGTQLGVIAQDVEKAQPEAVLKDPATGYRMVDYSRLQPFGTRRSATRGEKVSSPTFVPFGTRKAKP